MSKTVRGVYHNLNKSEYTISNGEVVFFFSSRFYLEKFLEEYEGERIIFDKRISKALKDNPYNMNLLSDLTLYASIEKRGFKVTLNGVDISWQEIHEYALETMTENYTRNWQETSVQKYHE